ncbi:hypothetical protein ACHAWF_017494 [Thalassiosira exigua]
MDRKRAGDDLPGRSPPRQVMMEDSVGNVSGLRDSVLHTPDAVAPMAVARPPHSPLSAWASPNSAMRSDVVELSMILESEFNQIDSDYMTPQGDKNRPVKDKKKPAKVTAEALVELQEVSSLKSNISDCSDMICLPKNQWQKISCARAKLANATRKLIKDHDRIEKKLHVQDANIQKMLFDLEEKEGQGDELENMSKRLESMALQKTRLEKMVVQGLAVLNKDWKTGDEESEDGGYSESEGDDESEDEGDE